jgi:hypothetical protein
VPNESDSKNPAADPQGQPLPQSQVVTTTPEQNALGVKPDCAASGKENDTVIKLEEDIKTGEQWLIKIGAAGVIMNVVIALIYFGQLKEMRAATRASEKAANAAASAADTADKTLKEIRAGGTDTHELAQAAVNQVAKLEASVKEAHALAKATRDALDLTRENFIKDQQPYMWPTLQNPAMEADKPVFWNISYSNYGRSPAHNMKMCVDVAWGKGAALNMHPHTIEECEKVTGVLSYETVVPPGYAGYTTATTIVPVDKTIIGVIKSHDGALAIIGTMIYDDASGHSYETTFCKFLFASGAIGACQKYNYIKQLK